MSFQSINKIQTKVVRRITTGLNEVDWLYGVTIGPDRIPVWGLPEASISLWAGESGIGKSRLAIELARVLSRRGLTVLYFQNEVTKEVFTNWVRADNKKMPFNFYISESSKLSDQIKDIKESQADVIFVDSISMLEEFGYGSDKSIKRVINGDETTESYRDICKTQKSHIILISQLTKQKDPRGSSTLSHLVDVVFHLNKQGPDWFAFTVGKKHRHGRTGDTFFSFWSHKEEGVVCLSDYSTEDKLWCSTHGIPLNDRFVKLKVELDTDIKKEEVEEAAEIKEEKRIERVAFIKRVNTGVWNLLTSAAAGVVGGVVAHDALNKREDQRR